MTVCRACSSREVNTVLDLGRVPAADHFPLASKPVVLDESRYALAMALCEECGLAQLIGDDAPVREPRGVEPEALTEQAAAAINEVAKRGLLTGQTVAEFGSPHGGTWLPNLIERGFTALAGAEDRKADVVIDSFGIMHEPDQLKAFKSRADATAEDGVLLLQFHTLAAIVRQGQWNALRHGHFAYYSLPTVATHLERVGMQIAAVWQFPLYGGTNMVAARFAEGAPATAVADVIERERDFLDPDVVRGLQKAVDRHTDGLRAWLRRQAELGRSVYAYGAASRAVSVLGLVGANSSVLAGVADTSSAKRGRRMPGTDVPIISIEELVEADPDTVILMVPDLLPEVTRQIPELTGRWWVDGADAYGAGAYAQEAPRS